MTTWYKVSVSFLLLVLGALSADADIPPVRIARSVVSLPAGANASLAKIANRLAHVPVPGYGGLFSRVDRTAMLNMGRFGVNIHSIIAMHENLFPQHKKLILPGGLEDLNRLENNVADLITHPKNALGWQAVAAPQKILLFESALPAYLITPSEDPLALPSAAQLGEALTYYRDVLTGVGVKGIYPSSYFAQQMSAVSNLGLLGNPQDASYILKVAQTYYGAFNDFKDVFITRALLNLQAYDELQQLADLRLAETGIDHEPKPLSAVWNGVCEIMQQQHRPLRLPAQRIAQRDSAMPEILQADIIAHHPFNYVLANPSVEVTREWLQLRNGLDEQFNQAAAMEGVTAQLRSDLVNPKPAPQKTIVIPFTPTPKPATAPKPEEPLILTLPPKPARPEAKPKARQHESAQPQGRAPAKTAQSTPAAQTPTAETPQPRRKTVPSTQVTANPRGNPGRATKNTPRHVRELLENYISENNNELPPNNHTLRVTVYNLLKKADPADPDVQAIQALWKARIKPRGWQSQPVQHHYDQTRAELEKYINEHGGLPPTESSLRKRAKYVRETGDPNDPDVQAITELLSENRQKKLRTPSVVRAELESYMQEHDGQLPVSNTPIRKRAEDVRKNGDPNDADVKAITDLLTANALKVKRDPASLRRDLETYLQEHDGAYPPNGSALNKAIQRVLKNTPESSDDADLQTVRELWQKHVQDVRKDAGKRLNGPLTSAQMLQQIQNYMAQHDGKLPHQHHPARAAAEYHLRLGEPTDPDLLRVRDILNANKKPYQKRTPAQVRQELEAYLQTHHNTMPPHGSGLDQAAKSMVKKYPQDPDAQALSAILEQHRQRKGVTPKIRTPKDLLNDLNDYLTRNEYAPYKGELYHAIHKVMQNGDPNDPDVAALTLLWTENSLKTRRSPQQVHEELAAYVAKGHTSLAGNMPLYHAARNLLKMADPQDPHVKAVKNLWEQLGFKIPTQRSTTP